MGPTPTTSTIPATPSPAAATATSAHAAAIKSAISWPGLRLQQRWTSAATAFVDKWCSRQWGPCGGSRSKHAGGPTGESPRSRCARPQLALGTGTLTVSAATAVTPVTAVTPPPPTATAADTAAGTAAAATTAAPAPGCDVILVRLLRCEQSLRNRIWAGIVGHCRAGGKTTRPLYCRRIRRRPGGLRQALL